jgi:hypothetical protein
VLSDDVYARAMIARASSFAPPSTITYALNKDGYVSEFAMVYDGYVTKYAFRKQDLKASYFAALWPPAFQALLTLVASCCGSGI